LIYITLNSFSSCYTWNNQIKNIGGKTHEKTNNSD
jgi:hypothetical protein